MRKPPSQAKTPAMPSRSGLDGKMTGLPPDEGNGAPLCAELRTKKERGRRIASCAVVRFGSTSW